MNRKSLSLGIIIVMALLGAGSVLASDRCNVPQAERQPIEALQSKLESQGWEVRNIKVDDGCYEVYAVTDTGKKVEAYFDPKSFDMLSSDSD